MIDAVTVTAKGAVYSANRVAGKTHVTLHTAKAATSLYQTSEKVHAIWATDTGIVWAAGKAKLHSNAARGRSGAWTTIKYPGMGMAIWGDDEIYVVTFDGELGTLAVGAWKQLAKFDAVMSDVRSAGAQPIYALGHGVLARHDRLTGKTKTIRTGDSFVGIVAHGGKTWVCGDHALWRLDGDKLVAAIAADASDPPTMYGIGAGKSGLVVHRGFELARVDGKRFVVIDDIAPKALMEKSATFPTTIASNGTRIAAGGARSVLVDDGKGFVEWPALR